jgi:hypothetical protein
MSTLPGGTITELSSALWRGIADAARGEFADATAFYGLVTGISGALVQVRRLGDDAPAAGENWYARLAGPALIVGDTVLVQRTSEGTPIVLGKVGGAAAGELYVPLPFYTTGSATNTSNVTWAALFASSFVLPAGSWDVDADWSANGWLSVDGHIQARPVVGGSVGGEFGSYGPANLRRYLGAVHTAGGLSGTVAFLIEFKGDVAGTSTLQQGAMRFACRRIA